MARNRSKENSSPKASYDTDAPRPFITYLLLAFVVLAVVIGAYAGRDAVTAFVVNIISPNVESTITFELLPTPALTEPNCATDCGRACWLVASGSVEGTFASAQGKIGVLGCESMCWSVADVADSFRCCRNSDCPRGELCSDGVCAV